MKKHIIIYGLLMAVLIIVLKYFEYNLFVKSLSQEIYIGFVALFFTTLGIWIAIKMRPSKLDTLNLNSNKEIQEKLAISEREMEVLMGMTEGLSNREIAEKLFLSENTIKTHAANLFFKLDVKRRTQAVKKARELTLIH